MGEVDLDADGTLTFDEYLNFVCGLGLGLRVRIRVKFWVRLVNMVTGWFNFVAVCSLHCVVFCPAPCTMR